MSDELSIGALSGRIELEDRLSAGVDHIIGRLDVLDKRFEQTNHGVAEVAAGMFTAEAAFEAVKEVVHLTAEALKEMTLGGAAVADVEENFDRLTAGANRLGAELLGALHKGTHDTVTDFELMKTVNQDLAAGMDLTADQFGALSEGAFALAQATGGDVKQALDTVNDAMLTGRVRSLQMLTGKIDLTEAERKFASSIGTTADKLSAEGKLEAARVAILAKVAEATGRLGEQTDGLDEKVAQMQVKWHNFTEDLGKTIATSPAVLKAFDDIAGAVIRAFGGDSQHAVETISGWVNKIAVAASTYGPIVIEWISKVVNGVIDIWHSVQQAWDLVPDWFKNIARDAALAGGAVLLANGGFKALTGTDLLGFIANMGTITSGFRDFIGMSITFVPRAAAATAAFYEMAAASDAIALRGIAMLAPFTAIAVAVASITAVLYAGKIAWDLWRQSKEAAADAKWQADMDLRNMAEAAKFTTEPIKSVDQALQILRNHARDLQGATTDWERGLRKAGVVVGDTMGQVDSFTASLSRNEKKFTDNTKAAEDYAKKLHEINKQIDEELHARAGISGKTDLFPQRDVTGDDELLIKFFDNIGLSADNIALRIKTTTAVVQRFLDFLKMKKDLELDGLKKGEEAWKTWQEHVQAAADKAAIAVISNDKIMRDAWLKGDDELASRELSTFDQRRREIVKWVNASKAAVDTTQKNYKTAFDAIDRAAKIAFDHIQDDQDEAARGGGAAADKIENNWAGVLTDISESFVQVAQIAGASFGRIAQGSGTVIVAMKQIMVANKAVSDAIESGAHVSAAALADVAAGYIGLAIAAYNFVKSLWDQHKANEEIKRQTRYANDLAAAWQKQADGVAQFTAGLNKSLDDLTEKLVHALEMFSHLDVGETGAMVINADGRVQAALYAQALMINELVAELGGLDHLTADQMATFEDRMEKLLELTTKGGVIGAQAIEAFDKALVNMANTTISAGGLVSDFFLKMVHEAQEAGVKLAGVNEYLYKQMMAAEQGIGKALAITNDAYETRKSLQDDLAKISPERDDLIRRSQIVIKDKKGKVISSGLGSADQKRLDELNKQYDELTKKLKDQQGIIDATQIHTQEAAEAVSYTLVASIDAMLASGMSWSEALRKIAPDVENLRKQLEAAGFEGGEAFDFVARQVALVTDAVAGPALQAAEGYAGALRGLHNANHLNEKSFKGLAGQIGATAKALEKQGFSHEDIMAAMQGDLQTVWELQQKYHFSLDETTQAMVDEAVAAGEVGEEHKSTTDQMLDATKAMTKAIIFLAEQFGYVADKAADAASSIEDDLSGIEIPPIDLHVRWDVDDAPEWMIDENGNIVPNPAHKGKKSKPDYETLHAAAGATAAWAMRFKPEGIDTIPAMLAPGESVLSASETKAYEAGRYTSGRGGGSGVEERQVVVEGDTYHVNAIDAKSFIETAQKHGVVVLSDVEEKRRGIHKRLRRAIGVK